MLTYWHRPNFDLSICWFWQERIREIELELKGHLQDQRKRLGCSELNYWGSAKDRYQIEVPERHLSRKPQVVLWVLTHAR